MSERREFEITEDDLHALLDASKPTSEMFLSGGPPNFGATQENAKRAWHRLAERMKFKSDTVRPIANKGQRFFTAEPA